MVVVHLSGTRPHRRAHSGGHQRRAGSALQIHHSQEGGSYHERLDVWRVFGGRGVRGGESTIKQVVPSNNSCTRHISGIMNMNNYYFHVAPNEDDLRWEFTIRDLIEDEFEERPDNFPTKAAKIEFLKELIADIEECVERVEKEEGIVV